MNKKIIITITVIATTIFFSHVAFAACTSTAGGSEIGGHDAGSCSGLYGGATCTVFTDQHGNPHNWGTCPGGTIKTYQSGIYGNGTFICVNNANTGSCASSGGGSEARSDNDIYCTSLSGGATCASIGSGDSWGVCPSGSMKAYDSGVFGAGLFSCLSNAIVPNPTVSCSASPNPANTNQTVTFSAHVNGGMGPFAYSWSGACTGSGSSCSTSSLNPGTDTATISVNTNGPLVSASCSVTVSQPITQHDHKACYNNNVYWYDSTNTINDLYQTCASGQVCQNAQCSSVSCNVNSDCGANQLSGSLFCQNGNVYQNYVTHTCNNPGTLSSSCSTATIAQLQTTCAANQTCSNGFCSNMVCTTNTQEKCVGNSLYWYDSCGNQGTFVQTCPNGCSGGACSSNSCTTNTQEECVGNSLYWYDSCGNQGTFVQTCPNGCSGGACSGNNCVMNTQEECNGNSLYWYDSCGDQGTFVQTCPNGCSGGVCENPDQNYSYNYNNYDYDQNYSGSCVYHASQKCNGSNLYWYDSCGDQQDLIQYCTDGCVGNSCQNYSNAGTLTATKTVKNLTSNSAFANSTTANPSDVLMFMITLQASGSQSIQNISVRDTLPANLIYNNQLIVACSGNNSANNCNGGSFNYSGDISSGISLNAIYAGQTITITYQAQVASAQNFSFGTTTLNNNASVTSSSSGLIPPASATVVVTRSGVLGASTVSTASDVSTGLTNNFWLDSFILPLIITLVGIWMFRSGLFFGAEKWLDNKKKVRRAHKAEKELSGRIEKIQKFGR